MACLFDDCVVKFRKVELFCHPQHVHLAIRFTTLRRRCRSAVRLSVYTPELRVELLDQRCMTGAVLHNLFDLSRMSLKLWFSDPSVRGVPTASGLPLPRMYSTGVVDSSSRCWLYGGFALDQQSLPNTMQDLWSNLLSIDCVGAILFRFRMRYCAYLAFLYSLQVLHSISESMGTGVWCQSGSSLQCSTVW
jgi:hypothetical protein